MFSGYHFELYFFTFKGSFLLLARAFYHLTSTATRKKKSLSIVFHVSGQNKAQLNIYILVVLINKSKKKIINSSIFLIKILKERF